eukprot:TRINITY_DN8452_c0_g1_i1.p1 TRINITY_DN8452_c0_g1~~TRINITY_DN8452_c0_g1_i1.p1  ORF type:complete len:148 (-),score=57.40 TRINITY_DN8452_c0_g1_i1:74-517(-)
MSTSSPSMSVSPLSCLTQCTSQTSSQSSSSLTSPLLGQRSRRDSSEKTSCLSSTPSPSTFPYQPIQAMVSKQTVPHPLPDRKLKDKGEKMMMMKCQRLTEDKLYEEIEISVPVLVFKRMVRSDGEQLHGERQIRETWTYRLKNIFIK